MPLLQKEKEAETKKKIGKAWTGWRPRDDEAKTEFRRAVLQTKEGESQDCLEQDQKMIEEAVEEIPTTRKWKETWMLDNLRRRSMPSKERQPETPEQLKDGVLRQQAGKARAVHFVKCCLMPGKSKVERKLLQQMYTRALSLKIEMGGKKGAGEALQRSLCGH